MKTPFKVLPNKFPICAASRCRNNSAVDKKGRKAKSGLCHACFQYAWRQNNPLMSYFRSVKDHARKRNIPFSITFQEFKEITPEDWKYLTVDRINPTKGYEKNNLQFITFSENAAKGNRERFLPENIKYYVERRREQEVEEPF